MLTLKEQLINDILYYYTDTNKLRIFVEMSSIDDIIREYTIDFDEADTVLYIHNVFDDNLVNITVLSGFKIVGWEFTDNISDDDILITKFPQAFQRNIE